MDLLIHPPQHQVAYFRLTHNPCSDIFTFVKSNFLSFHMNTSFRFGLWELRSCLRIPFLVVTPRAEHRNPRRNASLRSAWPYGSSLLAVAMSGRWQESNSRIAKKGCAVTRQLHRLRLGTPTLPLGRKGPTFKISGRTPTPTTSGRLQKNEEILQSNCFLDRLFILNADQNPHSLCLILKELNKLVFICLLKSQILTKNLNFYSGKSLLNISVVSVS